MIYRLVLTLGALIATARANQGFLTRLLTEDPGLDMKQMNVLEYYGEVHWTDNSDPELLKRNVDSKAYFTLLMSYEYATKTIRFHVNMKEPWRKGSAFLKETDMQFNSYLDLNEEADRAMVDRTAPTSQ